MTKSPKKSTPALRPKNAQQTGTPQEALPSGPDAPDLQVNIAPAAARRLSEEGLRRLAAARSAEANLPGWQSLGKGGKPDHTNGRQGPRERKVRW